MNWRRSAHLAKPNRNSLQFFFHWWLIASVERKNIASFAKPCQNLKFSPENQIRKIKQSTQNFNSNQNKHIWMVHKTARAIHLKNFWCLFFSARLRMNFFIINIVENDFFLNLRYAIWWFIVTVSVHSRIEMCFSSRRCDNLNLFYFPSHSFYFNMNHSPLTLLASATMRTRQAKNLRRNKKKSRCAIDPNALHANQRKHDTAKNETLTPTTRLTILLGLLYSTEYQQYQFRWSN